MSQIQFSRFKDAPWFPKEEIQIIVGGAGGIGSWLILMLARAGYKPIVYDFDTIEEHNIGGQLFPSEHIGLTKVESVKRTVKSFANQDITIMNLKYDKDGMHHHYMFSGFDNMEARKDMFHNWKEYVKQWQDDVKGGSEEATNVPVFIDGRLLMEQLTIFCVTPDKIEEYEKNLFDDSEVAAETCTLKQTSHSAAMIAAHMVGFFTNHYTNNVVGEKDRALPFKWEYFIPIDYIEVE